MVETHQVPAENVFMDWQEAADQDRFADAVIIATRDTLHEAPAIAFAEKGYHILLEKPMAPTPEACQRIVEAVTAQDIIFGVCHVMRYTNYTRKLKELIDSGLIGDVINIQHLEPVGYWHFAHSFVRGNWRKESESAPILLAKSVHDLDWLSYMMGASVYRFHPLAACATSGAKINHLMRQAAADCDTNRYARIQPRRFTPNVLSRA